MQRQMQVKIEVKVEVEMEPGMRLKMQAKMQREMLLPTLRGVLRRTLRETQLRAAPGPDQTCRSTDAGRTGCEGEVRYQKAECRSGRDREIERLRELGKVRGGGGDGRGLEREPVFSGDAGFVDDLNWSPTPTSWPL